MRSRCAQMDTRDLAPLVQPGAALYGIESTIGGVLLRTPDGVVAGSVGVSAGTVDEVAEAGRQAFTGTWPTRTPLPAGSTTVNSRIPTACPRPRGAARSVHPQQPWHGGRLSAQG